MNVLYDFCTSRLSKLIPNSYLSHFRKLGTVSVTMFLACLTLFVKKIVYLEVLKKNYMHEFNLQLQRFWFQIRSIHISTKFWTTWSYYDYLSTVQFNVFRRTLESGLKNGFHIIVSCTPWAHSLLRWKLCNGHVTKGKYRWFCCSIVLEYRVTNPNWDKSNFSVI